MRKITSGIQTTIRRYLNLHEYQASALLSSYNLPVLRGGPARSPQEALDIATKLGNGVVVKAQVHAGGRGRGLFKKSGLQSGVHVLNNSSTVKELSSKMLNDVLVTKQSGASGKPVNTLYVVEKVDLKQEIYLAVMIDREKAAPVIIASPKGGMGIEEIDKKFILQERAESVKGFSENQIEKIVEFLELSTSAQKEDMKNIIRGIYKCFTESDATLVEINPLGVLKDGRVLICDSKVNIDDNSKLRQTKIFEMEDLSQKEPIEVKAEHFDLNYVKLSGNVGCLVNGAGLAMATMDLINYKGGKPANFLDIGGTATADRVKEAISIINDDAEVKTILINIFGGIVRCDVVVEGIIKAVKELNIEKPIVMRIKGTNSDIAKTMVESSGLKLFWFNSADDAAQKAISLA
jgi:succinyl-CoA synthetase beta subunit